MPGRTQPVTIVGVRAEADSVLAIWSFSETVTELTDASPFVCQTLTGPQAPIDAEILGGTEILLTYPSLVTVAGPWTVDTRPGIAFATKFQGDIAVPISGTISLIE